MSQKRPFWPFWPVIFEAGWTPRLKSARRSHMRGFLHVTPHRGENQKLGRGCQMALMGVLMARLMQKGRLKSPQKSPIIENQAFGVILGILAKKHFGHFGQPFPSQGGHADKKPHFGSCLNQRDGATNGGEGLRSTTAPRSNSSAGGI